MDQENQYDLEDDCPDQPPPKKPKWKKIVYAYIFITVGFFIFTNTSQDTSDSGSWVARSIVNPIKHLVASPDKEVKGEEENRINLLLLGVGGRGHEGGQLTDTIMLGSFELTSKKAALISIPRDMSIPAENGGWQKINNISAYAEALEKGSGGLALASELSKLLEIPINYYLKIDFLGFEKIIDDLGGIEVNIERSFDDFKYPVLGQEEAEVYEERFEHLSFDKGLTKLDGSMALKYARSRQGTNGEGSDFARAKRQQNIIEAVKNELISTNSLKPKVIVSLIKDLGAHIDTNLDFWEITRLYKNFKDIKKENIIHKVIDNSIDGLLQENITPEGAYVLVPRAGNFREIKRFINNIFQDQEREITINQEQPVLDIRNGTFISGLATRTANNLEKKGFKVINIANASRRDFNKTIIYDLTYGEKIESLKALKSLIGSTVFFGLPDWLMRELANELENKAAKKQPDFIIILGTD